MNNLTGESINDNRAGSILRSPPASWNDLGGCFAGPTHERDWAEACIEAFRLEPYLVTVGPTDRPRALAPLALVRGRLESIGVRSLGEPMDFLATGEAAAAELAEALFRLKLPLHLRRMPISSLVLPFLRRAPRSVVVMELPRSSCPVLTLDKSWVEPEARISSRRRSDLRRARRRAGHIEAEVLTPTINEASALIEDALGLELKSWKARGQSAALQNPDLATFYRSFCMMKASDGTLRLAFLRVNGQTAAVQIAVERDNAYWLLKIAYDEQFSHCSPGQLLISHSISWAAARGLSSYEFLGSAEDWIRVWTESERPCVAIGIYPASVASALGAVRDACEFAKKVGRTRHAK